MLEIFNLSRLKSYFQDEQRSQVEIVISNDLGEEMSYAYLEFLLLVELFNQTVW